MGAGGKERLSNLVESWRLIVLSSSAFPFLCSSSLLISFLPLKYVSFLPHLPCVEHQLLPAEAGAFSWSRSWIVLPAASCCIYCTPNAAPFIYGICSHHFPSGFFSSTISWTIQNELVAYAVLVKLVISGVLTVRFGRDHERSFWTQSCTWMGAAVLRRFYEDKLSSLLEKKHQDPSRPAYCYPNCRQTLLINRGVGCLQARILLDPVSSCGMLGCCAVLS